MPTTIPAVCQDPAVPSLSKLLDVSCAVATGSVQPVRCTDGMRGFLHVCRVCHADAVHVRAGHLLREPTPRRTQAAQVAHFQSHRAFAQGSDQEPTSCDDHVCRYHSPSHPLRLVSGEGGVGRVRVVVDGKGDWPNADFEIGYAVWHEVITASCNVLPARPTGVPGAAGGGGEDPRGSFFLNVSPPAPDCAPVRRRARAAPPAHWHEHFSGV